MEPAQLPESISSAKVLRPLLSLSVVSLLDSAAALTVPTDTADVINHGCYSIPSSCCQSSPLPIIANLTPWFPSPVLLFRNSVGGKRGRKETLGLN